jgi:hypothetical protein
MYAIKVIFPVIFLMLWTQPVKSQPSTEKDEYSFMFYNSENLFDTENDSLTNDDEFTNSGERRWNYRRLKEKADRLAKVILAAGKWNPPIFVGLCEIEGLRSLETLTKQTSLNKYGYKIIHQDSPDRRGIDVALIYRPDLFKPTYYKAIPVIDPLDQNFKTRDILMVTGIIGSCDTVHLFVNHWPSRYGGMMETVKYRKLAATILKRSIDEVLAKQPRTKIICMGDFNDSPDDDSILKELNAVKSNTPLVNGELVNLSSIWANRPIQTLKNLYTWQVFDQWLVSDYFLETDNCIKFLSVEIFDAPFLLEPDLKYGGLKPKRTYVGYQYQEGFSDHLPITIKVRMIRK